MDHQDRDNTIITQQAIQKYWVEKKRTHRPMLKDKKDTLTSGKLGIGCDKDLNTTKNAYNEIVIIGR